MHPLLPKLADLMRSETLWIRDADLANWVAGEIFCFENRRSSTSCAYYVECPGGITGYFGEFNEDGWIFKQGFHLESDGPSAALAKIEAQERLDAKAKEENERKARAAKAADMAKAIYAIGSRPGRDNDYLRRKQVAPDGIVEISVADAKEILGYHPKSRETPLDAPLLAVPLFNAGGELVNVELIDPKGRKAALFGGPRSGVFWSTRPLGSDDGVIGLAEGMATAQTIAEHGGLPVVSVGGCGNFGTTIEALKARFPRTAFVVFADRGNGAAMAEKAAMASGAWFCMPPSSLEDALGTDFNDLLIHQGEKAVRDAIQPTIAKALASTDGLEGAGEFLFMPRTALQRPVLDFVIPGLLAGSVGLIVGQGSIGKSFLVMQMALAVLFGETMPWDGDRPDAERVKPGKVGVLLGEDDTTVIQSRYFDIFEHCPRYKDESYLALMEKNLRVYGMPGADMRIMEDARGELIEGVFFKRLADFCIGKRIVFIDPLGKLMDGNENDNRLGTRMMEKLVTIGRNTGCAIIVLHHVSKGGAGDREDWAAARGAGAITATARFQMNMRPLNEAEMGQYKVSADERNSYIHVSVSKVNYGQRAAPFLLRRGPGGVLFPHTRSDDTWGADVFGDDPPARNLAASAPRRSPFRIRDD